MRPLPPFNVRPLKRASLRKAKAHAIVAAMAEPPAVRASRLTIKPAVCKAKTPLKVLGNQ